FLEKREGLALVFLLGVLAAVAAQTDTLAQAFHLGEMILPEGVEYLQGDLLLEGTHVGTHEARLGLVLLRDDVDDALAQRLLEESLVFLKPLADGQLHAEFGRERDFQARDIPLVLYASRRDVAVDEAVHHSDAHIADHGGDVVDLHQFVAALVDDLALLVGYIVVFEQLLADVEVATFHFALRFLDRIGDDAVLDSL